jgi:hypothetical protein
MVNVGHGVIPIGICKPDGHEAEPGDKLLFATDPLYEFLMAFHAPENTRLSHDCPVNWTP